MYQLLKKRGALYVYRYTPWLLDHIRTRKVGVKYIISGGIAAVVQLSLLYILTELFAVWYVISAGIAYGVAVIVAFLSHKFWTFRDNRLHMIAPQFAMYGVISAINFFLNPLFVAFLVEFMNIWYIIAQIIVMIILAVGSFFANRSITFKGITGTIEDV